MTFPRRRFLQQAAGAAALPALSRFALAQAYPSRPIHLIVGFTPGRRPTSRRACSPRRRSRARPAGRGREQAGRGIKLAAQYVAHAAKDGYTLFVSPLSSFTNRDRQSQSPSLDLARDLAPVALLANGTMVLVVNPATRCTASPS